MPTSWKENYLTSLKNAELNNPVNMDLVQQCSHMADRISALEAEKAALVSASSGNQISTSSPSAAPISNDPNTAQLRGDLAEALRSKGVSETRLRAAEKELEQLRSQTKKEGRIIKDLTSDNNSLTTRLKDRDWELREKRKLLEDVQDEMIALNLQVSMAEKDRAKVQKENKELVDRWMKRMAQEAEAMNLANEPHMERGR